MQVGDALGPWVLRREIGGGGIAAVFIAEHAAKKTHAAVKVLRDEFAAQAETVAIFLGEPRAQQAIEHENTIEVEHIAAEGPRPYFVTELARGQTLAELLKRGPLPLARAVHIARQVAIVLAHAHDVDVVHRNLKPANVFLMRRADDADFVKLLELGATRMQSQGEKPIPGTLIGTPAYMAPEQLRQTAGGYRVDMYSFGVLLFELAVGRRPFVGEVSEVVKQQLLTLAPRARSLAPHVPESLDALIAQCLEKSPEARPPSMHEVALALAALEDNLGAPTVEDEGAGKFFAVPKNTSGYTTVPADATAAPPAEMAFEEDEPSFESVTDEHRAVRERAPARPAPSPARQEPQPLFDMRGIDDTLSLPPQPRKAVWPWLGGAAGAVVVVGIALRITLGGGDVAGGAPAEPTRTVDAGAAQPQPPPVPSDDLPIEPLKPKPPDVKPDAKPALDRYPVTFGSAPAGAQVWIRMDKRIRLLCTTPCEFTLPAGKEVLVELRLDGHISAQRTLTVAEGARFHGTLRKR